MHYLIIISFRNFLRQKRRNILLGLAIAFGVMVLTLSNAFSKGISETLMNRLIVYIAGHIKISSVEKGRMMMPIFRDREQMIHLLKTTIPSIDTIQEDVGAFSRAVGNGKGDYVYILGVDKLDAGFKSYFKVIEGNLNHFDTSTSEYPVIISEQKAKYLNLKIGDQLRIRLTNVNGQNQTGTLTVKAIVKSQNMYMDFAVFTPLKGLKELMGYQPYETGALKIALKDPQNAIRYADRLHTALAPKPAYIEAKIQDQRVVILPLETVISSNVLNRYFKIPTTWNDQKKGILISASLATQLGTSPGDSISVTFPLKFIQKLETKSLSVDAVIPSFQNGISNAVILMNSEAFFNIYNYFYPQNINPLAHYISLNEKDPFWSQIAGQWRLLNRTHSTKELQKKWKDILQNKQTQPVADVATMYETASQVMQMESAFNIITFVVGAVIFGIIMVGFLNSLRMTIRERTREIGTMRAIGMVRADVKKIILLEVAYLTILSWLVGIIAAFLMIKLLTLIQFSTDNPLNMIMMDRRLFFKVTWGNMIQNLILPLVFALGTAYFPARKASQLEPAAAFRHMT